MKLLLLLAFLLQSSMLLSQTKQGRIDFVNSSAARNKDSMKVIDTMLTDLYIKLRNADPELRNDSIAPLFKNQMENYLASSLTFENDFSRLMTEIEIVKSPNGKIKAYSWDELTGGTWHNINAFIQFKGIGNKICIKQIDTDKEIEEGGYTDSEVLKICEVNENGKVFYVIESWGTHGEGNQHIIVQVFEIIKDNLVRRKAFKQNKTELVVEYPRTSSLNFTFDKKTNSISFDEFKQQKGSSLIKKTGKQTVLRFLNGRFQ